MHISDLTKASEAVKLRFFDKETNNKALIDVQWHLLGNNKTPYLAVKIRQVKFGGVIVRGWKEQKEALKVINPDFYQLLRLHLTHLNGEGTHQTANMIYHFKQVLKGLIKETGDTMTVDRFIQYYNIERSEVLALFGVPSDTLEKEITLLSEKLTQKNLTELKELTNKYKIPLVITK